MQRRQMRRNQIPLGVVPGAPSDTVARVHGGRGIGRLHAEISAPRMVAGTLSLPQSLAMRIRPGETSEVAAFAKSLAGDEKTSDRSASPHRDRWGRRILHRLWRIHCALLRFGLLIARGKNERRAQRTAKAENRTH